MLLSFFIALFLSATVIQLGFLFILRWRKVVNTKESNVQQPVSVIICARNEAANLEAFLPAILQQDYSRDLHEVIVVDDGSTDNTAFILDSFQKQYPHLKIVSLSPDTVKTLPGKKYALSQGIAAARYERLLLTDADCRPASAQWLHQMTAVPADIVLGYGAYETLPGLLNRFIRWETVHTCMQYTGYALNGRTYMGVGRNLCYNRSLLKALEEDKAFLDVYRHTPSGDDDLLISAIAQKHKTGICLQQEAHTISRAPQTWKAWWRQKTRHVSTGKYYPAVARNLLGLYALSHSLCWFLGVCLLIANPSGLVIGLFGIRLLACWVNAAAWYRKLDEKKLFLFYPLGDLGWAFYNVFLSPYILWKNRQSWK